MASRSDSFRRRVQIERSVISVVNKNIGDYRLHGLTSVAISQWANRCVDGDYDFTYIQELSKKLLQISAGLKVEADTSRIVFSDEADLIDVEKLVSQLSDIFSS